MTVGNGLWPTARAALLTADLDWSGAATVKVALLGPYVYDEAHEFAADLTDVLDSANLTGRTVLPGGIADAADLPATLTVDEGDTVQAIAIYRDTGDPATSPLWYFADENDDGSPMARPGDGGTVPLLWSSSADRVFSLANATA